MPGAELTQGGVYDFNFNTRGFNSSLTRRVAVLIDGRNPSDPFFAAQEWSAVSFPLDDLARLELIRGPSAALYGPNASSGILNMVSKDPRDTPGGFVRFTFGQLDTTDLDFRWAVPMGGKWFLKAVGGVRRSEDYFFSRTSTVEYSVPCPTGQAGDCLPLDQAAPPRLNDNRIFFGGLRFDRQIDAKRTLTFEGGIADLAGPIVQTGVGRAQQTDTTRPWARFNADLDGITLLAAYTGRVAPGQFALNSNSYSTLKTHRGQFEGQTNHAFTSARLTIVAGASAVVEHIDSFDKSRGEQSVVFEPVTEHSEALFGQAEWTAVSKLKLVFAGRGDFSSLHETKFSPKAAAVYSFTPEHSLRVTYNNAFQVPNYSEFFLYADAAPSVNLTALNGVCALSGINCGFGPTRVVAVGNRNLELEEIQTFEVGYKGLIRKRTFVTLDYHRSKAENFITDLLHQLNTPLGRINEDYGPWEAPAGLPDASAAAIRTQVPLLSNAADGSNVLVAASYTNIGRVDTQGIDLGVASQWPGGWRSSLSYSWFDYELQDPPAGLERVLLPNTPAHAASAGIDYVADRFSAGFSVRWVDRFRWSVGVFQGDVNAYTTADVTAHYKLTKSLTLGLNVANVFDDRHWESFGGDILRRRVLASVMYGW
jgi:iron complex outermembrane receptor protein